MFRKMVNVFEVVKNEGTVVITNQALSESIKAQADKELTRIMTGNEFDMILEGKGNPVSSRIIELADELEIFNTRFTEVESKNAAHTDQIISQLEDTKGQLDRIGSASQGNNLKAKVRNFTKSIPVLGKKVASWMVRTESIRVSVTDIVSNLDDAEKLLPQDAREMAILSKAIQEQLTELYQKIKVQEIVLRTLAEKVRTEQDNHKKDYLISQQNIQSKILEDLKGMVIAREYLIASGRLIINSAVLITQDVQRVKNIIPEILFASSAHKAVLARQQTVQKAIAGTKTLANNMLVAIAKDTNQVINDIQRSRQDPIITTDTIDQITSLLSQTLDKASQLRDIQLEASRKNVQHYEKAIGTVHRLLGKVATIQIGER